MLLRNHCKNPTINFDNYCCLFRNHLKSDIDQEDEKIKNVVLFLTV